MFQKNTHDSDYDGFLFDQHKKACNYLFYILDAHRAGDTMALIFISNSDVGEDEGPENFKTIL
jgi:hypothetical protein